MTKEMRELLESTQNGDKVIAYIESLEQDTMLLTRENKALADDNELKCELNQELSLALNLACEDAATQNVDPKSCTVVAVLRKEYRDRLLSRARNILAGNGDDVKKLE